MKERLRPTISRRTKRNLPVYMTKSSEQRQEKAGAGIMLGNGTKRLVLTAVFAGIPWSRVRVEAVNSAPPQPHQTNFTTSTTMGFAVGTVELSMKELPLVSVKHRISTRQGVQTVTFTGDKKPSHSLTRHLSTRRTKGAFSASGQRTKRTRANQLFERSRATQNLRHPALPGFLQC